MSNQVSVQIGEHVSKVQTWNPAREAPDQLFNYIDIGSVSQTTKSIIPNGAILGSDAPSRARQLIQAGDVLVSTVRPNLNAVAYVGDDADGATASTGFCVLRPQSEKLDGRYLYHWVMTSQFVEEMVRQATGQSYPAVSDKIVKSSLIPLPPLGEQKRIAGILDQADALRRLRAQALDKLNTLGQAIFHEMFGSSDCWKVNNLCPVSELADFKGGGTPKKSISEFYKGDIPWVTPKDMKTPIIKTAIDNITEEAIRKSSTNLIPKNSVLIVNRSGILKHTLPVAVNVLPVAINQDLKALVCKNNVHHLYLVSLIKAIAPEVLNWVRATTADNFPIDNLKNFLVPKPSFEDQVRYAQIITKILAQVDLAAHATEYSLSMFSSLQHRAFRGEL